MKGFIKYHFIHYRPFMSTYSGSLLWYYIHQTWNVTLCGIWCWIYPQRTCSIYDVTWDPARFGGVRINKGSLWMHSQSLDFDLTLPRTTNEGICRLWQTARSQLGRKETCVINRWGLYNKGQVQVCLWLLEVLWAQCTTAMTQWVVNLSCYAWRIVRHSLAAWNKEADHQVSWKMGRLELA